MGSWVPWVPLRWRVKDEDPRCLPVSPSSSPPSPLSDSLNVPNGESKVVGGTLEASFPNPEGPRVSPSFLDDPVISEGEVVFVGSVGPRGS